LIGGYVQIATVRNGLFTLWVNNQANTGTAAAAADNRHRD
jgi:hypothetical protein